MMIIKDQRYFHCHHRRIPFFFRKFAYLFNFYIINCGFLPPLIVKLLEQRLPNHKKARDGAISWKMFSRLWLIVILLVLIVQIYFLLRISTSSYHEECVITKKETGLLPFIVFVTPTAYKTTQKADLTRIAQTLSPVPALFWIVVEDSNQSSPFIDELMKRTDVDGVHLTAITPANKKLNISDPSWKYPRGVEQRNAALRWIRQNLPSWQRGVLYFGDDDNTYDWRLFEEMRTIKRVGIWPVGVVGGLLVETPLLTENSKIRGFNARWKPKRSFPIDMAGFAVNLSIIHSLANVQFTFKSQLGYQESDFLASLGFKLSDLEPKAANCTKVYVWHTRTEKTPLMASELTKFLTKTKLNSAEQDAIS